MIFCFKYLEFYFKKKIEYVETNKKMSSSDFERKTAELSKALEETYPAPSTIMSKISCIPIAWLIGGITPFILGALLYFLKPNFILVENNGKYSISGKKWLLYTLLFSTVIWLCLFAFTYCKSYVGNKLCLTTISK